MRANNFNSFVPRYLRALAYTVTVVGILAASPAYAGQNGDAAGRTSWTLTGGLLHARESFQAATLLDGRVLAEGGDDGVTILNSSVTFALADIVTGSQLART